uniref:Secreted protein n=1 Tax=Amblyomma americanum TaxID=6943 RepID=A0A0C9S3J5_AMBAM
MCLDVPFVSCSALLSCLAAWPLLADQCGVVFQGIKFFSLAAWVSFTACLFQRTLLGKERTIDLPGKGAVCSLAVTFVKGADQVFENAVPRLLGTIYSLWKRWKVL